jgi:hypothetical protein
MIAFSLNATTITIVESGISYAYAQGAVKLYWLGEGITVKDANNTMLHRANVRDISAPQFDSYVELQTALTAIFLAANVVYDNRNADGTTAAAGSAGVIGWLSMIWDKIAAIAPSSGGATEANQTNGEQKTQVVGTVPLPTGAATQTTLAAVLTELQLKADLTETQPVSVASLPLPSGAATAGNQNTINTSIGTVATNQTNGTQITKIVGGTTSTGTATTLVGTTSGNAFLIIAANTSRKGLLLTNASNKTVLIGVGFTPTAALYSYSLANNAVLEIPFQFAPNIINGVWTAGGAASGQINVTQSI